MNEVESVTVEDKSEPVEEVHTVKLTPLASWAAHVVWPSVSEWVQEAADHHGRFTAEDILAFVQNQEMQAWVVEVDGQLTGVCVTEVISYPRRRVVRLVIVAGRDFDRWSQLLDEIQEWARQLGCQSLEFFGRRGWERRDKRWKKLGAWYEVGL